MALLSTDPICFARDPVTNDLIVPMRIARGLEAIAILIRTRLLLWRDEWFLDRDAGTPWLETEDGVVAERDAILGQAYDAGKTQRALRPVILGVTGVTGVRQCTSAFDGEQRILSVSCVAVSQFGDVPVSVQLGA